MGWVGIGWDGTGRLPLVGRIPHENRAILGGRYQLEPSSIAVCIAPPRSTTTRFSSAGGADGTTRPLRIFHPDHVVTVSFQFDTGGGGVP